MSFTDIHDNQTLGYVARNSNIATLAALLNNLQGLVPQTLTFDGKVQSKK